MIVKKSVIFPKQKNATVSGFIDFVQTTLAYNLGDLSTHVVNSPVSNLNIGSISCFCYCLCMATHLLPIADLVSFSIF